MVELQPVLFGIFIGIGLYYYFSEIIYKKSSGDIPKYARTAWEQGMMLKAFNNESFAWLIAEYYTIKGYNVSIEPTENSYDVIIDKYNQYETYIHLQLCEIDEELDSKVVQHSINEAEKRDIDNVIIITTSQNTQSAFDKQKELNSEDVIVQLITGVELVDNLNQSNLNPLWPPKM
jgi:hypothetical protein